MRLDPAKTDHFLAFITQPSYLQDVAFGTKTLKLDSGEKLLIPAAIRTVIPSRIISQYQEHCTTSGFTPHSERTLFRIMEVCAASQQKSLQGLDYIATDGSDAFDTLEEVVNTLVSSGALADWGKNTKLSLKKDKRYLKSDFKTHVSLEDPCPDHCIIYALNDNTSRFFSGSCNHAHDLECPSCCQIKDDINKIKDMALNPEVSLSDEEEVRLRYQLDKATEDIDAWKAHILRCVNQDIAKNHYLEHVERLDENAALIVMDWAMKFLPRKYREQMTGFYGKRGRSWHVSAVITKGNQQDYDVMCYVHIFEECTQSWFSIASIIEHLVAKLKSENPSLNNVYLRSDNAGCYHSAPLILSIQDISQRVDCNIHRYDFSDPQGGKDICDRKIAPMKTHINNFVNEKHDVIHAADMRQALVSYGGVRGCRIAVAEVDERQADTHSMKLEGISSYNNFQWEENGIRVWKAYNVGEGKLLKYTELDRGNQQPTGLKIIEDFSAATSGAVRKAGSTTTKKGLFHCLEAGCVLSFDDEEGMLHHMSVGKHTRVLEQESSYDRIKKQWAMTVSEMSHRPTTSTVSGSASANQCAVGEPTASQSKGIMLSESGWALQKPKKHVQTSDQVKDYLIQIFNKGTETKKKADPATVAHSMMHTRGEDGKLMFQPNEWKTAKQIASFFSRLAATQKRKQLKNVTAKAMEEEEIRVEDVDGLIAEQEWQQLRNAVYTAIDFEHPIKLNEVNVCELSKSGNINKLKLAELKLVCTNYEVVVLGAKNKKFSYITALNKLLTTCSCRK